MIVQPLAYWTQHCLDVCITSCPKIGQQDRLCVFLSPNFPTEDNLSNIIFSTYIHFLYSCTERYSVQHYTAHCLPLVNHHRAALVVYFLHICDRTAQRCTEPPVTQVFMSWLLWSPKNLCWGHPKADMNVWHIVNLEITWKVCQHNESVGANNPKKPHFKSRVSPLMLSVKVTKFLSVNSNDQLLIIHATL